MSDSERILVLNESLDQIAQEAHHLLLIFKRHIAFEYEKEVAKIPLDDPELVTQRKIVVDAMLSQWNIIRTLCILLAENTVESLDSDLKKQKETIEKIFNSIKTSKSPFKEHEYHFPFHVLKLLTTLKTTVKEYVSTLNPHNQTLEAIEKVSIPSNRAVLGVVGTQRRPVAMASASTEIIGHKILDQDKISVMQSKKHFESIGNQIATSANNMKRRPVNVKNKVMS